MKTPANGVTCPKCHNSGMSFVTEAREDGCFTISWTPCDCNQSLALPMRTANTPSPVFL